MKKQYKIIFIVLAVIFVGLIVYFTISWPKVSNEAYAKVIYDGSYNTYEGVASDGSNDKITVYMQTINGFETSQFIKVRTDIETNEETVDFSGNKGVTEVLEISPRAKDLVMKGSLSHDYIYTYYNVDSKAVFYELQTKTILYFNFDGKLTPIVILGGTYKDVLYEYLYYNEEYYNGATCQSMTLDELNALMSANGLL